MARKISHGSAGRYNGRSFPGGKGNMGKNGSGAHPGNAHGKTERTVTEAMLAAMYAALAVFSVRTPGIKISLAVFPVTAAGLMYGPAAGFAVGLLGSAAEQMCLYSPGVSSLIWIMPPALRGLMTGLFAQKTGFRPTVRQTGAAVFAVSCAVTVLNTAALYADSRLCGYYSAAVVFGLIPFRIAADAISAAVCTGVCAAVLPAAALHAPGCHLRFAQEKNRNDRKR